MSGAGIDLVMISCALEQQLIIDTELTAESLQLAVTASCAGKALTVVIAEQELKGHPSALEHCGRVSENFLALIELGYGVNAGSNKASGTRHFNNADTAGAYLVDLFEPAERRDPYTVIATGFQNGSTLFNGNIYAVNFNINHYISVPFLNYSLMIAPKLQFDIQAPHLMHFAWSITCGSLTLPVIAFTGQFLAHFVQPLHLSATIL